MDAPPDVTERGARAGVPSLLADPKLHFESHAAQQASRGLVSAILARKGIVVLEAAPGLGKTHALLRLTQGGHLVFRSAYVRVRDHDLNGLRARAARALALDAAAAGHHGAQAFNSALLTLRKEGSTAVLALDDAHRLSDGVLAALPSISPREPTTGGALLQIVLAVPPGFGERLERPVLEPLRERVAEIVPLSGLEPAEVGPFLEQRLAGAAPEAEWSETTVEAIAKAADGNPRVVTWLAESLLESSATSGSEDGLSAAAVQERVQGRSPAELSQELEAAAREEEARVDAGAEDEDARQLACQAAARASRRGAEAERLARLVAAPQLARAAFAEAETVAARARARADDEDWEAATVAWVMARNLYGDATARALRRGALPALAAALVLLGVATVLPPQLRTPALVVGLLGGLLFGMPFADRRRDRSRRKHS